MNRYLVSCAVLAAAWLVPAYAWAVYFPLPASSDDWGMKYEIVVSEPEGEKVTVTFTLADAGKLAPIHSATVVAFSKPLSDGGRSYVVKAPLEFQVAGDGSARAQVQIPQKHAAQCQIRILTLHVNGRRQTAGAAYYDLPLKKHVKQEAVAKKEKK